MHRDQRTCEGQCIGTAEKFTDKGGPGEGTSYHVVRVLIAETGDASNEDELELVSSSKSSRGQILP